MEMESTICTIQVKLITKQEKYAIPDTTYNVPFNISTVELDSLINELLQKKSRSNAFQKFDYLINEELIPRESKVEEFITVKNILTEHEISIEYVEATPSPQPLDCLMHDDWVAAVHSTNKWILSGCYDNSVHIWSSSGKHLLSVKGHSSHIKGVNWINVSSSIATFVSVGQDQTALLWEWNIEQNFAKSVYSCRGHERCVNCVHSRPSHSLFVTGGWDTTLKIWSADTSISLDYTEEESSFKKRKGVNTPLTRVPKMSLKGHKDAISTVQWTDDEEIMSASWDHTIKLWDAEYGGTKSEIVTNKAIFNAHYSNLNHLIITCGADRHVRLYDPRSKEGCIVKMNFLSHKEWVQAVKWGGVNSNLFVSGSYDSCLKLWDVRCFNTPLNDMIGHEDKILCCDWSKPDVIISGGCDSTLRLFSIKQ